MAVRPLSKSLQQIAESELNEVPSRISEDLEHIRGWIEKQSHLKCRTDDQWLLNFLRGCKFSLERTKEKLDNFYTIRSLLPELLENRDPLLPQIQDILNAGFTIPLPQTFGEGGPRIIYFDWSNAKIETMPIMAICKVCFMVLDALLVEDDNFVISGMWFWIDYGNFPLGYILQLTPALLKKTMTCAQECYPGRIKGMHYTNAPKATEIVFDLIKAVASDKIKNRMSMNSAKNMDKFEAILPKKYWPKEFGGENGSIADLRVTWKKKIEDLRDWFLEEETYGSDEKLRPKPKTSAEIFGVEGAFRKLNLD